MSNYAYLDNLDADQKKVCCRTENTIVAAGAGSGKTQVLASRFAWLVMSEGIEVSKILTLTFTNKAAAEMYQRIYRILKKFRDDERTPEPERSRAKEALKNFTDARIQTLDSYCAGIVRRAAGIYGIRPDFTAGSADSAREIRDAALPFVFEHLENTAVKKLAEVGKIKDFAENIIAETVIKHTSVAKDKDFFTETEKNEDPPEELLALCGLLDEFAEKANDIKRKSGNLTFRDVSELALKILREQPEILESERAAYSKIMIDEFQDNNGENKDLLFLLAGKGDGKNNIPSAENLENDKLFFVGDEKQSIYRFRGADVSVFNSLKTELGAGAFFQMVNNYRSDPELISDFNILFGSNTVFDNATDKNFEAKYTKNAEKPGVCLPEPDKNNVRIHISMLKEKSKDCAARFIAAKIKEIAEKKGGNYSDFAILDRTRTDRKYIIKWLNTFKIPFTLDQNSSIFGDSVVNDIYTVLRCCVYPEDRLAEAAYLASPFCGFSEAEIEARFLTDCMSDKLKEAEKNLAGLRETALSQPVSSTVSMIWNVLRYETLSENENSSRESQFDMIFELARQCDESGKSPAWFVDQLSKIKKQEKQAFGSDTADLDAAEISFPSEKREGVHVMTIHKSKGLQFKTVFLRGCGDMRYVSNSGIYFDDKNGLSIKEENTDDCSDDRAKSLAEFRRLIYVGTTRAEKEVYIILDPLTKEQNDFKLLPKALLKYYCEAGLDPNFGLNSTEYKENAPFDFSRIKFEAEIQKTAEQTPEIGKIAGIYENAETVGCPEIKPDHISPSSLEPDIRHEKTENDSKNEMIPAENRLDAAAFGTLAHAFLEAAANGIDPEKFEPEAALRGSLNDDDFACECRKCIAFCKNFARNNLGQMLKNAKENKLFCRAEWNFRMFDKDGSVQKEAKEIFYTGSIDLIFGNGDGTYTIVDYKSDEFQDKTKYFVQQKCYRAAAAKMLGIDESGIRCFLYWLKTDSAEEITEFL